MKLAWLCYHGSYENDPYPVILFVEPERWEYQKIIPIVYAVLETDDE